MRWSLLPLLKIRFESHIAQQQNEKEDNPAKQTKDKGKRGITIDIDWKVVSHGIGGFLFSRLVRNLHLSSGKL